MEICIPRAIKFPRLELEMQTRNIGNAIPETRANPRTCNAIHLSLLRTPATLPRTRVGVGKEVPRGFECVSMYTRIFGEIGFSSDSNARGGSKTREKVF